MKKFQFRLQSVLDARIKHLENCQLEMAKVQNELSREAQILENFFKSRKERQQSVNQMLKSGQNMDFPVTHTFRHYLAKTGEDIARQKLKIMQIEKELDEKKQVVMESLKAKTMLERLKEKDYKAYIANLEKLDLMEIDEIANRKSAMKNYY